MNQRGISTHLEPLFLADWSVIVNHFHIVRIPASPDKTDAVLIVDANAVLAFPVTAQSFQPVAWRHGQILQRQRGIQNIQFLHRLPVQISRQPFAFAGLPKLLGIRIATTGDHGS
jgi:hypothetical protein